MLFKTAVTAVLVGLVVFAPSSAQARARSKSLSITKQAHARTDCFPSRLRALLAQLKARIGPVAITSGGRHGRGGSLHHRCMAVDFRPLAVSNHVALASMRSLPGIGGIGTYRRSSILHMDIGAPRRWRH